MIILKDIFPHEAAEGDRVMIEDVEFTYYSDKHGWYHEEPGDMFDYASFSVAATILVYINKNLMNERNWWLEIK